MIGYGQFACNLDLLFIYIFKILSFSIYLLTAECAVGKQ